MEDIITGVTGEKPYEPKPTIGRTVHFEGERDGKVLAAIITGVNEDGSVNLFVIGENGLGFRTNILQGEGCGKWNWPPRV